MTTQRKTVFLDRDGVLIHDVHYLANLADIQFYPDVPAGLRRLKTAGFQLVVITNQSGVARGYFPISFVETCHKEMNRILESHQASLDALYFCPHHVDGQPPLNIHCHCRKPAPGLIYMAQNDLDIDLDRSYMIGDKTSDIELAINAGVAGILLTTGQGEQAVDHIRRTYPAIPVCSSFTGAVDRILS